MTKQQTNKKLEEDRDEAQKYLNQVQLELQSLRNAEQQLIGRIQLYNELLGEK